PRGVHALRPLPSSPTRRSSDLAPRRPERRGGRGVTEVEQVIKTAYRIRQRLAAEAARAADVHTPKDQAWRIIRRVIALGEIVDQLQRTYEQTDSPSTRYVIRTTLVRMNEACDASHSLGIDW